MIRLSPPSEPVDPLDLNLDLFSLTNQRLCQMSVQVMQENNSAVPPEKLLQLVTRIS